MSSARDRNRSSSCVQEPSLKAALLSPLLNRPRLRPRAMASRIRDSSCASLLRRISSGGGGGASEDASDADELAPEPLSLRALMAGSWLRVQMAMACALAGFVGADVRVPGGGVPASGIFGFPVVGAVLHLVPL